MVERLNKTIRSYLNHNSTNWNTNEWWSALPYIQFNINSMYHTTTKQIPFEVYRNKKAPMETMLLDASAELNDTVIEAEVVAKAIKDTKATQKEMIEAVATQINIKADNMVKQDIATQAVEMIHEISEIIVQALHR